MAGTTDEEDSAVRDLEVGVTGRNGGPGLGPDDDGSVSQARPSGNYKIRHERSEKMINAFLANINVGI